MICLWAAQKFTPSNLSNLEAWYRLGMGITIATGVSQWADQSGNARHLAQAATGNQPLLQGDNSLLFDGVDDQMKVTGGFTLNQPETVYLLMKQVSWTLNETFTDGNTSAKMSIFQNTATPTIALFAGNTTGSNNNLAVGTYAAVAAVFNGASSFLQVNNTAATTGNAGAANAGGFSIGCDATPGSYANFQVKEVIVYSAAHDQATRDRVIAYLLAL